MQFGLINSYSSPLALEKLEPESLVILQQQLLGTGEEFLRLRRGPSPLDRVKKRIQLIRCDRRRSQCERYRVGAGSRSRDGAYVS